VTLDLATSPFDAWLGTTAFWEHLLSPNSAYPDWLPPDMSARQMNADSMIYALSRLPTLDLPSIRGLALLLVLYIVLVGPVNFLVLRRLKRLQWGWVSVPLITLVFTAGAFGLGYALRGTDLIVNKIAVVRLGSDGIGHVTSYVGLFSPNRQSYEINVQGGGLLSPLSPAYDPWGDYAIDPGNEIVFVQGEPSQVRGLTVNQWSMQHFMAESDWSEAGQIWADLEFVDDAVVGSVRNEMPHTLKDTVLILGNYFVRVGDLAPGQEAPVTLDLANPTDRAFGQPLSYVLFEDEMMQKGRGASPNDAELKRLVIENAFGRGGGMSPISSWMPWGGGGDTPRMLTLIGWLDDAPPQIRVAAHPQVKVSGRTPAQKTTALLYAPLPYDLPDSGEISLPPGLIPGDLIQIPAEGGTCGPNGASVWIARGTALFEFQIPEEAHDVQIEQIKLAIRTDDGGGWWDPPQTAVYDWDSDDWPVLADPIIGVNVIPDAGSVVSEDGLVRVRLSSDGKQGGGCLYVELGLEGRR
jgi:hypothetical protein